MTIQSKYPSSYSTAVRVRKAVREDHPALVNLLKRFAHERGYEAAFDPDHASRHMHNALDEDLTFLAFVGDALAGAIICRRIEIGFCRLPDVETDYLYVLPEYRQTPAILELLDAMEAYADANDIAVCVHQLDYLAAVAGEESNGRRVELLFKRRKYRGPVGEVVARQPYTRAGITYLYEGRPHEDLRIAGVKLPPKKDETQ